MASSGKFPPNTEHTAAEVQAMPYTPPGSEGALRAIHRLPDLSVPRICPAPKLSPPA